MGLNITFLLTRILILLIVPSRAFKQKASPSSFTLTRWGYRLSSAWPSMGELTGMEKTHIMIPCCLQLQKQTSWCASPASLSEWVAKTSRSPAYRKLLPHHFRLLICRISLRHQVVVFTEAPPWRDDFQGYQTPDLSWATPQFQPLVFQCCALSSHLRQHSRLQAALTLACTSVSLCTSAGLLSHH